MMLGNPLLLSDEGGYQISRSVRLRSSASGYFSRTFAASGTTATFSFWLKRGTIGTVQTVFGWGNGTNTSYGIDISGTDVLDFYSFTTSYVARRVTTQVFRDPSSWYHIVCVQDTSNATASDRMRVYVNGNRVTAFSATVDPAQNTSLNLGTSSPWRIGSQGGTGTQYADGYLTEINFIDGQALTPASFGQNDPVTGVWQAKKYAGTYGTNGFYLNFKDPSSTTTIGYDYSGNANNWTSSGVSVTAGATYDSMVDVPTMGALGSNYPVYSPICTSGSAATYLTQANLSLQDSGGGTTWRAARATISMPPGSGKWYWEAAIPSSLGSSAGNGLGVDAVTDYSTNFQSGSWQLYWSSSIFQKQQNLGSGVGLTGTPAANDILQVAFDAVNGQIWFGRNGTWFEGNPSAGTGASYTGITSEVAPCGWAYSFTGLAGHLPNFGQRPFQYTPPTGFLALNTQNLPDSTIKKGSNVFQVVLDTGANIKASCEALFTYFVEWIKDRANANNHQLLDTVRGTTAVLQSNTTGAETTYTAPTGNSVGWVWNLGAAASSNTAGSITSQVAANVSAGISEVTYTGTGANATVGHGLGVAPKMVIVKPRQTVAGAGDWQIWHTGLSGAGYSILLNSTAAQANSGPGTWNSTAPTSTVFSLGTNTGQNNSGTTFVGFCFSEVPGFSKFGSYTGNGSADGPFVYCGFRPKYLLFKRIDTTSPWTIQDTSRSTYNVVSDYLDADDSSTGGTFGFNDFLSNGFKLRATNTTWNTSGGTYIFMAFAENPFRNSLAR